VRFAALWLICAAALQIYFVLRVALMAHIDPQSTSFQRSEAWRLLSQKHELPWRQQWLDYPKISNHLKRAVIAAEDAGFVDHSGVEWDAMERAWERNHKAPVNSRKPAKIVGGSTITQQLAKNLFLDSERNFWRKAQELPITWTLEALLSKERILEIYLNNVEWGEGVFGAEAAAQHYFRTSANRLSAAQAARLAVMLPAPKRFEKRPASAYLLSRAAIINTRMNTVELP
jgi:monofunctional glycosyltransferase